MATTWGPWVRVTDVVPPALTVTGTIWARIAHAIAGGDGPTHAMGASVGAASGSVELKVAWSTLHGGGLRCYAEVWAGEEVAWTGDTETYWIDDPEWVDDPEDPTDVPDSVRVGPDEVSLSYTISFAGLVLKRRLGISKPDKRQHMHPKDALLEDGWFMTPDFAVTTSCSGPEGSATVTSSARRDWPEYEGLDDGEIPDASFDSRDFIAISSKTGAFGTDSDPVTTVSVTGCNFDGVLTGMSNGLGAETAACRVVGSGTTLTYYQDDPEVTGGSAYAVGFRTQPPARWTWDTTFSKFDHEDPAEALDPLIDAGYLTADGAGGGTRTLFAASELPNLTPVHDIEILPGICDHSAPLAVGTVYHPGGAVQMTIDRQWALDNACCPGRVADGSDEFGLIETLDDALVPIDAPGVNKGVGALLDAQRCDAFELASLEPVLTLVLDKDDPEQTDPLARWAQSGQLLDHPDPLQPTKLLRWFLPESLYGAVASPGGDIEVAMQTRYWDRMALLPQQLDELPAPNGKNWRWPWKLDAQALGVFDADTAEPTYAEDKPFSWQASGYAAGTVHKPKWLALVLTITVRYSWPTITDPHYTSGYWRAEEYEFTRNDAEAVYTVTVPAATAGPWYDGTAAAHHDAEFVIDLLCPDSGATPRLFHVDSIVVEGLRIPPCTRTDKPEGFEEGGYLEWYADSTNGFRLCRDRGHDHTGRNVTAAPQAMLSAVETWDYDGDWQSVALIVDGAVSAADLPDEPAANSGPEKGLGYVEKLRHSPDFTGDASRLDYARLLTDAGIPGWNDRLSLAKQDAALAAYLEADSAALSTGFVYWLGCDKHVRPATGHDGDSLMLTAAVRVRSWTMAPGIVSIISARKQLWGRARALLKVNRGRRRLTPDYLTDSGLTVNAVLWRCYAYEDADGATIAAPGGRPDAGHWEHYATVPLSDGLSKHGIWQSPPLPISRTAMDTGKSGGADGQTDQLITTYTMQLWASDDWEAVDFNDMAAREAMILSDDCWGAWDIGSREATRLWHTAPVDLSAKWLGRIDLDMSRPGVLVLARPSHVKFPTETAEYGLGMLVDGYSPRQADGKLPYRSTLGGDYDRPSIVPLDNGRLVVACRNVSTDSAEVRQYEMSGIGGATVQELTGYTLASVTAHPATRGAVLLARRTADGVFYVAALEGSAVGQWRAVGEGDARHAALWCLPSGRLLAGLPRGDDTVVLGSDNGGATWSAHSTVTGVTLPSGTLCPHTGCPVMLGRDSGGHAVTAALAGDTWTTGAALAACDPVAGGITVTPDGKWLAALVKGGKLRTYTSADRGANWTEATA